MDTKILKEITVKDLKDMLNQLDETMVVVQEYDGSYRGLTLFVNHNNDGDTAVFFGDPRNIFGNNGENSEILLTVDKEFHSEDYNYSDYVNKDMFLSECDGCSVHAGNMWKVNGEIYTGEPEVVSLCQKCYENGGI